MEKIDVGDKAVSKGYTQVLWVVLGFVLIFWLSYQIVASYIETQEIQAALDVERRRIEALERKTEEQMRELRALHKDPYVIEQRLRDQTGKARPGEIPMISSSDPE
jgi:cell division protein FtsB